MDTKIFWEDRLSKGINLRTTGHRAFNIAYNQLLYQAQVDCLDELITENKVTTKNSTYLDIGCGGGFFVEYFSQKGIRNITGLDIAQASIDYLEAAYPSFRFFKGDISEKQLVVSGTYEIISAISVLFHIVEDSKFEMAMKNICGLMKPGGYLILCDTFTKSLIPGPGHVRNRPLQDYQKIFHDQGVRVVDMKPVFYFMNRVYIPFIGPWFINMTNLGRSFYTLDHKLRLSGVKGFAKTKFLLALKDC